MSAKSEHENYSETAGLILTMVGGLDLKIEIRQKGIPR